MPILGNVVKRALHLRKRIHLKRGEPLSYQERVLKKLLQAAKDTDFGRHYQFAQLLKSQQFIADFQSQVPMHNYISMYRQWWHRAMEREENVFWPGKMKYFALSSGTSEASSKYIPVSKEMLKAVTKASVKQFYSMANFKLPPETFEKGIFTLGSSTNLIRQGDYFIGDMSGIQAGNSIPFWVNRFIKPGKDISAVRDWDEKLAEIAKNAPKWDIGVLCGIPVWIQIMIERILEHHKADNIHEIWPNLNVYIHGGINFEPYRKNFDQLFGRPVTLIETYMASEGFFGFRAHPDATGIHFILNNGIFYEFVPFKDAYFDQNGDLLPDAKACHIGQVEKGMDYAVLISTVSGAWRYLIGDTVRFLDTETKEFIITGRTKHFLSICGEHLSVDNMNRAVQMTADEIGATFAEFTVSGIPHGNLFAHRWYIGVDQEGLDKAQVRQILDRHLRDLNDDYATERDNVLKDIQVELIPTDWFYAFLRKTAKVGDQVKFPRVMKAERFKEWEAHVAQMTP